MDSTLTFLFNLSAMFNLPIDIIYRMDTMWTGVSKYAFFIKSDRHEFYCYIINKKKFNSRKD